MNRKATGILMLICLAGPLLATYSWLQWRKARLKREVRRLVIAGIDQEELALLKFTEEETRSQLRWNGPEEFEYRGQMYDVVESCAEGDTLYFWCWWDHKETQLDRHIEELLAFVLGKDARNKEAQKRLAHFFRSLYFSAFAHWKAPAFHPAGRPAFAYIFYRALLHYPPPVPPPEYAFHSPLSV
ncbi:MAG: hypothetical protein KDD06_06945 [Phaeodactylibacter sp.]|nr:hypothetical protein [Phaeodactylibacter sp.]